MRIEYDPAEGLLNIEFVSNEAIVESLEMDEIINPGNYWI
jgi:hypothetical protein